MGDNTALKTHFIVSSDHKVVSKNVWYLQKNDAK